jgi:hypothetical protein
MYSDGDSWLRPGVDARVGTLAPVTESHDLGARDVRASDAPPARVLVPAREAMTLAVMPGIMKVNLTS